MAATSELCPAKERCGSCGWSHIPYDKQLQQKLSDINGSFALKGLATQCEAITASPHTSHYRNRMDFVIDFEGRCGLREKGKWWRVIDRHPCFIGDTTINALFDTVALWVQSSPLSRFCRKSHHGTLRYAVIRASRSHGALVSIVTSAPRTTGDEVRGDDEETIRRELDDLSARFPNGTSVIWAINHTIADVSLGDELHTIAGVGVLTERINGIEFTISPQAFFQTNSTGAEVLLSKVTGYAKASGANQILDLYCGSGFFSLGLARLGAHVTGIELVPEAILDAQRNAERNGITATFIAEATESSRWYEHAADLVVVDPPRSGMKDSVVNELIAHGPKTIIYVSCNYKQLARELVLLDPTYSVTSIEAVDMFPHTPHVEVITVLSRR